MMKDDDAKMLPLELAGLRGFVVELSTALPAELLERLSPAEVAIVEQILEGRSTREIAKMRETSVRTVDSQLAALYQKLGVGSRGALAALVVGSGKNKR